MKITKWKVALGLLCSFIVLGFWPTRILSQTPTVHSVVLTWSASATTGVTYAAYRGTASGGPYTLLQSGLTVLTYTDTTGTGGTTYYYVVDATCGSSCPTGTSGTSANSNQVSATFLASPAAPGNLAATAN